MFTSGLKEVKGVFDRRTLLNYFFPSLVFCGLLVLIWVGQQVALEEALRQWRDEEAVVKGLQIGGFLAVAALIAMFLAAQVTQILRLYEGRWPAVFGPWLAAPLKKWHRRCLEELARRSSMRTGDADAAYEIICENYPLPTHLDQVMPTRLGNILRNGELYATDRYKIDAVLVWPRLYHLLPKTFIQSYSGSRAALDFMLVVSTLGIVFAVITGAYLGWNHPIRIHGTVYWLWWGCVLGGLAVGWLAYVGALGAARNHSQHLRAAFDLYRNLLLKQMRLSLPSSLQVEPDVWEQVCHFLYRGIPDNPSQWVYTAEQADCAAATDSGEDAGEDANDDAGDDEEPH